MNWEKLDETVPLPRPNFWEHAPGKFLAWNEWGTPAGQPVFYYHGWPSSRLQARLAHHLSLQTHVRLIAMDRPGMGQSSWMPERKLEDWPDLMSRFADHLGVAKFGQLGVSGGGPYVMACAARIPDRITASAVLAGMVPLPMLGHGRRGLHPIYRLLIPLRKLPAPVFTTLFRIASHVCQDNPDEFPSSLILQSISEQDRRIITSHPKIWGLLMSSFTEGVCGPAGGRGIMTDAEIYLSPHLIDPARITHPIRYWHGADDRNIPASLVKNLCELLPASQLVIVEGLGHFSLAMLHAEEALNYLSTP